MSDASTARLDEAGLLDLAVAVAERAGRLVVERRRHGVQVSATKSSPTDIVTAVDVASEQLIRAAIRAARPDDGFVGEEGDDVVGSSGVTWVADPIDGTVNFLYGIPQFAVSLAATFGGEALVGVVHNPVSGETFAARRGAGATLSGTPIRVSTCHEVPAALVGTGFAYRADVRAAQGEETARLLPVVRDVRRFGSAALDLCAVACGRLDAYVERGLKPWDLAAGGLIASEAGAKVAGLADEPATERLVVAAPHALYAAFEQVLVGCGYADWPLDEWPE